MIDIVRSESYLYTKTFSKIRNLMEIKRICKRTLFIIALLCCNLSIFAQRTFSYSLTSSFCPQTGTGSPTMMAYAVTIGDGYVEIDLINTKKIWMALRPIFQLEEIRPLDSIK